MSRHDIVVFGATGFTGRKVVEELVTVTKQGTFQGTYALAGRSLHKLERLAASVGAPSAPLIIADVHDEDSMRAMAASARLVISTVGPFRVYGERCVAACVAEKTDYLDVCGEPEFIERMEMQYNEDANKQGCYIASAVGFDSVPGDVGAWWASQQFVAPARCTLIETYITIRAGPSGLRGHYPTYQSAVEGFGSSKQLAQLRRRAGRRPIIVAGPSLPRRGPLPKYDSKVHAWTVPFLGSDASVVRRTCAALASVGRPAYRCAVYLTLPNRLAAVMYTIVGFIFAFLARFSWTRKVLLAYPRVFSAGVFSHDGPNQRQIAETSFEVLHVAQGYSQGGPSTPDEAPDVSLTVKVAGPEPGYIACSIFIVAAAIAVLQEREHLGVPPGVHTPAILLQNTRYVELLRARGIFFDKVT